MAVDIICIALLLLFTASGYRNGAFLQAVHLGLIVGAFFLARWGAIYLGVPVAELLDVAPRHGQPVALLGLWFASYVLFRLLLAGLIDRWRKSRLESGGPDRITGGILGLAKGLLLVYVVLATLLLANKAVARKAPSLWIHYQASHAGAFVARYNVFDEVEDDGVQTLARLVRIASDPDRKQALKDNPEVRAAIESLARALTGPERADGKPDAPTDGAIEKLKKLLEDPDLLRALDAVEAARPQPTRPPAAPQAPPPAAPAPTPPPAAAAETPA